MANLMRFRNRAGKMLTAVFFSLLLADGFHYITACRRRSCHRSSKSDVSVEQTEDDKVWLFAVDGRKRPYSFLSPDGNLIGFDVDLISKVCEVSQKTCKMVLAEFPECSVIYRDINYAGRGLMSGWFDACPGYVLSVDRVGAFDFTDPYLKTDASFTVAPGNPSKFDPDSTDYSKFVLTHLTGAVTNAQCLSRLGKTFGNIILAADLPDAKNLILNGTADVLFSPRNNIDGLEVLPQRVRCDAGGTGIATKKGSQLSSWWNPAFKSFVLSGGYADLCTKSHSLYNATIRCLPDLISRSTSLKTISEQSSNVISQEREENMWLFAVSGNRKPFNFLDEDGTLTGFDVDFVNAVCAEANQQCSTVLAQFTECTFTERNINYPGRGLMDGWFDACTGYANSLDRESAFDFTDAYLMSDSTFSVAPGNPTGFDPNKGDFSNFTFTHLTGAYTNAACLNRLKKKFGQIIIAANLPAAKELLLSGKVDVLFSPRSKIPDLETLPLRVNCAETGTSIMVKRGSPLVTWWNEAFHSFVKKGLYQKLCEDGKRKYSYPIRCFPNLLAGNVVTG